MIDAARQRRSGPLRPTRVRGDGHAGADAEHRAGQGFIGSTDLTALLSTYAETAKSSVNRARAEQILGRKLPGEIDTSTVGGTGILRITGATTSPSAQAAAAARRRRRPSSSRSRTTR